jgi:hypothetical protein
MDNGGEPSSNFQTGKTSIFHHGEQDRTTTKQPLIHQWTINRSNDIEGTNNQDILPFGTEFPPHDPQTTLQIVMQNTQYSLQLTQEDASALHTITNLKSIGASIFTAISPIVNWCNASNHINFKRKSNKAFQQIHISATSSNIGHDPNYFGQKNLTGGVAILTFDHWATKISQTRSDPRGHGTFTVTTIRGRNGKHLSLIGAYISVNKGQHVGPNTVWNQQLTLMEREAMK